MEQLIEIAYTGIECYKLSDVISTAVVDLFLIRYN